MLRNLLQFAVPGVIIGVLSTIIVYQNLHGPLLQPAQPAPAAVATQPNVTSEGSTPVPQKPPDDPCRCRPGIAFNPVTQACEGESQRGACQDAPGEPVNGCDGKAYGTPCAAYNAGIKKLVKVEEREESKCHCGKGQVFDGQKCVDPGKEALDCGAASPAPMPLCGCDGGAYASACEAKKAGVKSWITGFCLGHGTVGDPMTWKLESCPGDDGEKPRLILTMADGTNVLRRADGTMFRSNDNCR